MRDASLIAPYTYVITPEFLVLWGLDGLHELPDLKKLQGAGFLSRADTFGTPQP
jgi:chromosome segregation and condensation protein ScpB